MMTYQDWKKVEDSLWGAYGQADLVCDGYKVTLSVRPIEARRYAIMAFVNGTHNGRWMLDDCEERRRFLCPNTVRAWKPRFMKGMSKKGWRSVGIDLDKRITVWSPYWTSFRRLKAHLLKHNQNITLVKGQA